MPGTNDHEGNREGLAKKAGAQAITARKARTYQNKKEPVHAVGNPI